MAVWSIVKYSELGDTTRLDGEFYRPEYLEADDVITSGNWAFLGDMKKSIKSFGAYSLCNQVEYKKEGIPFIRCCNVKDGTLSFSDVLYIDDAANKLLWKSEVKPENVLLTMSGTVGDVSIAYPKWDYPMNSNQDIAKIVLKEGYDPYYLAVFLLSDFGRRQTKRFPVGSVQQHFFLWQIDKLKIALLNDEATKLIADKYRNSLDLFDTSRSLLAEAEGMLLAELGLDSLELPKAKWNVRNFSETRSEERIDGEYYLPKYYAILKELEKRNPHTLGEIADYKKGIEVGAAAYEEEGVPFWRVSDLSKEEIGGTNTAYISEELYESLKKKYEAKQGEILFSKDATPGLAYFVREHLKGILCGGILRLQLKEDINPDYLTLLLNSEAVHLQIVREGGGSIINHLRPERAMSLVIPIIDRDKQNEIGEKVRDSHSARAEAKRLLEDAKRTVEEIILEP